MIILERERERENVDVCGRERWKKTDCKSMLEFL